MMLRLLLTLICISWCASAGYADEPEYFEGAVTMHVEIEIPHAWMPIEELYWVHGTEQTWTYARGDFRIDYLDSEMLGVWYRRDKNREYSARVCEDFITWVDIGEPFITVLSVRKTGLEREIAGYKARAIDVVATVDGDDYSTRYWYAPSIPVNPNWFAEDRYGGFASLYEHIDSLIVGIDFESDFSSVRRYATEIEFRPVSDEELALPDMPTQQAPDDGEGIDLCPMPE